MGDEEYIWVPPSNAINRPVTSYTRRERRKIYRYCVENNIISPSLQDKKEALSR